MLTLKGYSQETDARKAVIEATSSWTEQQRIEIDFILVYFSTKQNPEQLATTVAEIFPNAQIAGCSTSGEFLDDQRYEDSLVILGISSPKMRWQVGVLENIDKFNPAQADQLIDQLTKGINNNTELNKKHNFCIVLQDGLAMREELITAALTTKLDPVPLLGGSAGDDLKFQQTSQIANGKAFTRSVVVILGYSEIPFAIIKDQHYTPAGEMVVVTDADASKRRVFTLDGYPAAEFYAEMVKAEVKEVGEKQYGQHPLIYSENNKQYIRSIQKIEDDGSITFYCAIEQGILLELGRPQSPDQALQHSLERLEEKLGSVNTMFVFSCILCKLEIPGIEERLQMSKRLNSVAKNVIGFDSYGEQLDGLHINQTMVAIGFADENS